MTSDFDPGTWFSGPGPDTSIATSSRVWDLMLGGKDNYAVDREVCFAIRDVAPEFSGVAVDNQQFLIRAGAYLAGELGITQYLDCGAGLPTTNPLHDVVQSIRPEARVLYVDNDPIVLAHAAALLAVNANTEVVAGDIFDPDTLLANEMVRTFLDWSQPVAIIHTATLHHHQGETAELSQIMQAYVDVAAVGSCTVVSHFLEPDDPSSSRFARDIEKVLLAGLGSGRFRPLDQIHTLFPGQDLVAPGIVACRHWPNQQPPAEKTDSPTRDLIVGGIGRKQGIT